MARLISSRKSLIEIAGQLELAQACIEECAAKGEAAPVIAPDGQPPIAYQMARTFPDESSQIIACRDSIPESSHPFSAEVKNAVAKADKIASALADELNKAVKEAAPKKVGKAKKEKAEKVPRAAKSEETKKAEAIAKYCTDGRTKAITGVGLCMCGCGELPSQKGAQTSLFRMGHDAKLKGILREVAEGNLPAERLGAVTRVYLSHWMHSNDEHLAAAGIKRQPVFPSGSPHNWGQLARTLEDEGMLAEANALPAKVPTPKDEVIAAE